MPELKESKTYRLQRDLGNYCRTGKDEPETSIQEHTYHYRRLITNIIHDTLSTAYPITVHLIGKENFKKAVDFYFENHKCQTAQIWKMPYEFYAFYTENPFPFDEDYPILQELLLFEWLEIEVYSMEDAEFAPFKTEGDMENDILVPNPEIKIQPLTYPLHKKKTKQITEDDKSHYFVSIHRDYHTKKAMFNDLSYPFVEVLLKIHEEDCQFSDLLPTIAKYEPNEEKQRQALKEFITFALEQNILLGYKP